VSDKPAFVRNATLMTPTEIRKLDRTETARLRTMLAVEDMLSDVLTVLAANQVLDDTYVFFMSDNGLMLGEHRLVTTKDVAYEEAIRVPFIVMGPGIAAATHDEEHFVLNVDIAPTLAELAGVAVPDTVDGRRWRGCCGRVRDGLEAGRRVRVDLVHGRVERGPAHARLRLHRDRVGRARALRHAQRPLPGVEPAPPRGPRALATLSARLAQITGCRRATCRQ
jgi:arylsulfatase A-like enzyme